MHPWNRNLAAANMTISQRNMTALYQMPLSSIADRAGCLKVSARTIRIHTNDLSDRKKIEGCTLAATHRAAQRHHLTEDAARTIGQGYAGWNSHWGLSDPAQAPDHGGALLPGGCPVQRQPRHP